MSTIKQYGKTISDIIIFKFFKLICRLVLGLST